MPRTRTILISSLVATGWTFALAANAQEATPAAPTMPMQAPVVAPAEPPPLTGLWLTTDYPSLTQRIGDDIRLDLTLANKGLPPKRVELSVTGVPDGWTSEIDGGGKPVTAAMVKPDSNQALTLKLTPPKDAKAGTFQLGIEGKTDDATLSLPVTLVLSEAKPATVTVTPKLPALRGSPRSTFDFDVDVKNEGQDDDTFNLLAKAPAGYQVTFKEQYGSQELTSIPIKGGETKSLKVSVKLPQDAQAGQYQVDVAAASPKISGQASLLLDVTGQPTLALTGPEGRLSGEATAGQERSFKFTLANSGTAPATGVKFDATPPQGWKVEFDPKDADALAPGEQLPVSVTMTPSNQAIAGDYVVTVRAAAEGASDSQNFRVTVLTSTMWGIAGLGIIGAAVVVLAFAVTRYGRR